MRNGCDGCDDLLEIFLSRTDDDRAIVDGTDQGATVGVPRMITRRPRQLGCERSHKIVDGPTDDGVVVHSHVQINDANGVTHSCMCVYVN